MRTRYVVGFAFDGPGRVALIRKTKPAWQRGLLNGIGGKVEDHERFVEAMSREFMEEAGLWVEPGKWWRFCRLVGKDWLVEFFVAYGIDLDRVQTMEEEQVVVRDLAAARVMEATIKESVPNLAWLLPMAAQGDRLDALIIDRDPRDLR